MLASPEWLLDWCWHHGCRTKRLELAYCQFLSLVPEMPATLDCIDFEGPPDRLQITKTGGYPMDLGSEAGGRTDIISHDMAELGNGSRAMAYSNRDSPLTRRPSALGAPPGGSIRPPGPPAQIDALRSCVFLRKYWQKVTVSLGGYPRGYATEPQQSSFRPSARSRIYPWVYSWAYPRVHSWAIPRPGAIPTASAVTLAWPHA